MLHGKLLFNLLRNWQTICSTMAVAFYNLNSNIRGFQSSTFSPIFGMVSLFHFHPSYRNVELSHFPNKLIILNISSFAIVHLYLLYGKMTVKYFVSSPPLRKHLLLIGL